MLWCKGLFPLFSVSSDAWKLGTICWSERHTKHLFSMPLICKLWAFYEERSNLSAGLLIIRKWSRCLFILKVNWLICNFFRQQAETTGQRLKNLNWKYTKLVCSTLIRAVETADIIAKHLPEVPRESCDFLQEGAPAPPDPPSRHWRPDKTVSALGIQEYFRQLWYLPFWIAVIFSKWPCTEYKTMSIRVLVSDKEL